MDKGGRSTRPFRFPPVDLIPGRTLGSLSNSIGLNGHDGLNSGGGGS